MTICKKQNLHCLSLPHINIAWLYSINKKHSSLIACIIIRDDSTELFAITHEKILRHSYRRLNCSSSAVFLWAASAGSRLSLLTLMERTQSRSNHNKRDSPTPTRSTKHQSISYLQASNTCLVCRTVSSIAVNSPPGGWTLLVVLPHK